MFVFNLTIVVIFADAHLLRFNILNTEHYNRHFLYVFIVEIKEFVALSTVSILTVTVFPTGCTIF